MEEGRSIHLDTYRSLGTGKKLPTFLLLACQTTAHQPSTKKMCSSLSRTLLFAIICMLVLVHQGCNGEERHTAEVGSIDCPSKCNYRCSKASRHNMCIRACNTCCQRCSCVPPGTSGNADTCPCWANMTTHGGRKKCP